MTALTINKYLRWLRALVDQPGPSYDILFDIAWAIPYRYTVPNDINRAQDGLMLRRKFESETSLRLPRLGECRMLEFLIGVAFRLNEVVYDNEEPNNQPYWFGLLLNNLELQYYDDSYDFSRIHEKITNILNRLNARQYEEDGSNGGLFPLEFPEEDQRKVEVWYQMHAYLQENFFLM